MEVLVDFRDAVKLWDAGLFWAISEVLVQTFVVGV